MNTSQGQGSTNADKPPVKIPPLSKLFGFSASYSTFNMPHTFIDLDVGTTGAGAGTTKKKREFTTKENIESYKSQNRRK